MNDHSALEMAVADSLRRLALDERLKAEVLGNPRLVAIARRVADRYIGGTTVDEAVATARQAMSRGHLLSLEYMGESVRDPDLADEETAVFESLVGAIAEQALPSTVSLDLSHIGSVVDPEQGYGNARRIAAAASSANVEMMISAEGSDRTDLILATYERLVAEHSHVGITVQARLHRSKADLDRVLSLPGRIRLVKGAFLESADVAFTRDSAELRSAYLEFAERVLTSRHPISIATHDSDLIGELRSRLGDEDLRAANVEFEMLLGLGTELLASLAHDGFATREYIVFGREWWLYVLNRIAENPARAFNAIVDVARPG